MAETFTVCCAIRLCPQTRCRDPLAKFCQEHLIIEIIKHIQHRGNYTIGSTIVRRALEGATGPVFSNLRKVSTAIIKHQDQIIAELRAKGL